jgi:uncharacterized cupin superfamily protein
MERSAIDEVENWLSPATEKRPLARALGADHVAVNYYELGPGEAFGFGYHRHPDQEELFVILAGEATFETEHGEVTVGTDETIRFAPGEWQLGRNDGAEHVRALAIGAPAEDSGAEMVRDCPDCGERTPHGIEPREDGSALVTVCDGCGAETGRYT